MFVRNALKSFFASITDRNQMQIEMCDTDAREDTHTHTHTDTHTQTNAVDNAVTNNSYCRTLSTRNVMHLWRIIAQINEKYEFSTQTDFVDKLSEIMSFEFDQQILDCFRVIDNAVEQRLIVSQTDLQTNRFRFVANRDTTAFNNLTHDWYCFECHSNQQTTTTATNTKLIHCKTCWRSFHEHCVQTRPDFQCDYCGKQLQQTSVDVAIGDTNRLNRLLKYIMINCDYFLDDEMYDALGFYQLSNMFVFHSVDLRQIQSKILVNGYETLNEFENDVKQFEHNFLVSPNFTDKSLEKRFRKFQKLFGHELSELKICVNCYDYSNELQYDSDLSPKSSSDWFCRICSPPHELVYARIKGYSYWPSKLLRVTAKNQYDVRFFDPPNFTRALVTQDKIKPITHEFTAEYIGKWKLEQPIRLMMEYMKKLNDNGIDIAQTATNESTVKYKEFVKFITPLLKRSKRKRGFESDSDDERVIKKIIKNKRKNNALKS